MARNHRRARSRKLPDERRLDRLAVEVGRIDHKRAAVGHSARRANERYELVYDDETRARLVDAVRNGRVQFVARRGNKRVVLDVKLRDRVVRLVWDKKLAEIVTLLPPPEEGSP